MDVIVLVNIFRYYLKVKSEDCVAIATVHFPYGRCTKTFCTVERLVKETRTWTLFSATPKYLD